jgi:FAD/FMN-containing dehydrogenase
MSLTEVTPAVETLPAPRPAADGAVPAADVDALRACVHGPVYAAGDEGLAAEVFAWNVAVTHTPAVAVGATCAADVATAVSWAAAHGLPVAVQATGHGPVRNADGAVLVSTRRMQGVTVDPVRRTARVEAGVRWERVLAAAAEHGLTGLCGSSSDVGVVGYTLGGGMGSLGRRFGFAADAVVSFDIRPPTGCCGRSAPRASPSCSGPCAAARAASGS